MHPILKKRYGLRLFASTLLVLNAGAPAYPWGGKVRLERRYRPGQAMVYETLTQTRAEGRSQPAGLEGLLPLLPSEFSTEQRNTVRVSAVREDGSADIETRIDRFEIHSKLSEQLPESMRDSVRQAQEEFARHAVGQTFTSHYNREGRLVAFEGADEMLRQLDEPFREPLRQTLAFFLEQMSGNVFYPDHPLVPTEQWSRKLTAQPSDTFPFSLDGEAVMRYVGKAKSGRVKAAAIEFRFTNTLTPELDRFLRTAPLAQLHTQGIDLDTRIEGEGQGRVLLALDDGRMLENHSTIHQKLTARLKSVPGSPRAASDPITLQVLTETRLEVQGESQGR